jgi:hypothetical protein
MEKDMSGRRRHNRRSSERRVPGVVRVAGWLVLLLAALSLVTWRQARGVELERALRELETARGIAEADRASVEGRVEELRGRARVVRVARDRLGMIVPADQDIVFLPMGAPPAPSQLAATNP